VRTAKTPQDEERWHFFRTIGSAAPECLEELRSAVVGENSANSPEVAVRLWCTRWNLNDEWCHKIAFQLAKEWAAMPATAASTYVGRPTTGWHDSHVVVRFPPIDASQSVSAWKRRCHGLLEDEMKLYLVSAPIAPVRDSGTVENHYAWTIKYQVLEQPYAEIAGPPRANTVQKSVRRTALALGLSLRASTRGRPRRSS
jgi:hypothetical protein